MLKPIVRLLVCVIALTVSTFAQSKVTGTVSTIIDGQTITVAVNSYTTFTVRLRSIETPDDGQQLSEVVVAHLGTLALNKTAELRINAISNEAIFGQVIINGVDLSQQMLRDGAAWYSDENSSSSDSETIYRANEQAAKSESRGLWEIAGLKKPSELRKAIETAKDPLNDSKVSQLAWEQLGYSVEGVFPSESFTPATGNCGGIVVGGVDGDTVRIQTSSGQQTVRLRV